MFQFPTSEKNRNNPHPQLPSNPNQSPLNGIDKLDFQRQKSLKYNGKIESFEWKEAQGLSSKDPPSFPYSKVSDEKKTKREKRF